MVRAAVEAHPDSAARLGALEVPALERALERISSAATVDEVLA